MNSDDRATMQVLELDDDGGAIGVSVVDARQPGEAFVGARLVDVELLRCDLSGCDFSEAVWDRVQLTDCRASAIELPQSNLRDVTFRDCRLDDANFRMAHLRGIRFDDCVLTGAEFAAGRLDDVRFPGSDLARADFLQARCTAVDLRRARLDGLRGILALKGATIAVEQLIGLAPALAQAVGLQIRAEEDAQESR